MRFHWYWPFARDEELAMADAVLHEGDEVVVEVIDRDAAPAARTSRRVSVVRDLREVNREVHPVAWVPSRAATYLQRARTRSQHWKSDRYDLFHVHYLNRYTDAAVRLPAPLVLSVHDAVPHVPRLGSKLEHGLLARVYSRPDALVIHHQHVADQLVERFHVPPERLHVIPYPVLTRIDHPPEPVDPPVILLFGALRPNKGLEIVEAALRQIADPDIRVVIAGRGHVEQERLARAMEASDPRVTAELGFISLERKAELFTSASIIALPYTSFSSQSAVLQDAYGFGRPVVATDVGALGETVRADGTGIVVPPGDVDAFADAIRALLDRDAWSRAAEACVVVAAERSPSEFGRGLRAVYERLLS